MDDATLTKISETSAKLNGLANVLYGYCNCFAESSEEVFYLLEFIEIFKQTAEELNLQIIESIFQESF